MSRRRLILKYNTLTRNNNVCPPDYIECPEITPTTPTTPPTETTPTIPPTEPTPPPGYPVNIILSNFTGAGGETCSIYNGTYTVNAPYINGEASNYIYELPPQNEYVISNSVDVGYNPNSDDIYICLNVTTPDGFSRLCQQYDIDWNTGNYAVAWGLGFPSTPWCIGDINLEFSF